MFRFVKSMPCKVDIIFNIDNKHNKNIDDVKADPKLLQTIAANINFQASAPETFKQSQSILVKSIARSIFSKLLLKPGAINATNVGIKISIIKIKNGYIFAEAKKGLV